MPYFPNTPEKLLGRNDSKNPSSTCKGITSNGRPCRRALATPKSSPAGRRTSDALNGVVALVQQDGEIQEADFYCWQHKDQAEQRVEDEKQDAKKRRTNRRSTELFPLQEKSSIDTMVQRLGLDAEDDGKATKTKNPKPPKKTQTNDFAASATSQAPHAQKYGLGQPANRPTKPKSRGFWASLCCMTGGDDDYVEVVRHKNRVSKAQVPEMAASGPAPTASVPGRKPVANPPSRPTPQQRRSSNAQTNGLLSLLPPNLSPQTTSTLLAELVKPISPADEEGYIYIFWLTPQTNSQPSESTARSLLTPPSARAQHERRISDVITEFSFDGDKESTRGGEAGGNGSRVGGGTGKKTIMLKIGRANNITRRMNEWSRQCGYALNLVRFYPYVPSSGTPTPSPAVSPTSRRQSQQALYPDLSRPVSSTNGQATPGASRRQSGQVAQGEGVRKVPYVKRVERLIHLELAEQRVMRQCAACGKEHREWFEVEASQAGVKGVDETVRRWVGWAEREAAGRA